MPVGNVASTPLVTTGVPSFSPVTAAPVAGTQAVPASVANPTSFGPPVGVTGGGIVDDFKASVGNAVTRITDFAQRKMQETQNEIQALFNSEGGPMDAAKLQLYSQKMTQYEMVMNMAAKIQEKEERAAAVWTRP